MSTGNKITTDGGQSLGQNPFGALSGAGLPATPSRPIEPSKGKAESPKTGFVGIGPPEKEQLAKKIRGACGCGGTVKDGDIEIQGDQRETIARILTDAGFRPVMAGG